MSLRSYTLSKKIVEARYDISRWSKREKEALFGAAKEENIVNEGDGLVKVTGDNFPAFFGRMAELLAETTASAPVIEPVPTLVNLPQNRSRISEHGFISQFLARLRPVKLQT